MMKLIRIALLVYAFATLPALAAQLKLDENSGSNSVDIFVTVTAIPEDWRVNEASDPNPRPVEAQRFVTFRGEPYDTVFDGSVQTPFEFRMFFMDGVEHHVVIESIEVVTRGSVKLRVVKGRMKSDELSRINLVLTDQQIQGTMHFDGMVIEFRPVVDNISVIQRVNATRFPKEQEPKPAHRQPGFVKKDPPDLALIVPTAGDFTGPEPYDGGIFADTTYEVPEIGVLVVWSDDHFTCDPDALEQSGQTYQEALDDAFAGYATSQVDVECTSQSETWSTLDEAWGIVTSNTAIKARRKALNADLVVMLVQDGHGSCGFTMYPDYPLYPIDDYVDQYALGAALAIVDKGCAIGQSSLAHEIGHLMGMKHERFNELGGVNDYCGYGYPVMKGNEPFELTIMSYDDYCDYMGVSCVRKPYYSIPRKKSTGLFGWLSNALHKCFGVTKGISCESTESGHLNRPANDTMQLIDAAPFVATYSDKL